MKKLIVFVLMISTVMLSYVVVTINPYYLLTKEILDGVDEIKLLLPPNINPHIYSLKVSDVKLISNAKLVIANGDLEPNLKKFDNVIYIRNFIPDIFVEFKNPHFWLEPYFVKFYIVPYLSEHLYNIYKEKKIIDNAKRLIKEIDEFLRHANTTLKINGTILVHHPSFYYFFKEFGIKIKWLEEGHNVSTSVKKIINTIKGEKLVAIFSEKQQSQSKISIISKELKIPYFTLDPLGVNAKKFLDIYYNNLEVIKKALSNE
ncbi:metal ABC transporter substrate-binding protein [Thermosipho melanesiensis]|uniref:Periplasmic solute binding protein n=2 Tax=Thermosipho melanesiensis TaxID=46541 RepID=A6LK49_THEM4|nr:metal ABC transporter substrate-binding protein [Thermosipho melanesiensis]ABR30300.1 periplasmic solute binding protein [Thermosipho melanesiensis BI429]APT73474.1 metal ABC transporter substrate-binding protein [Thermosipho melanesiensis]